MNTSECLLTKNQGYEASNIGDVTTGPLYVIYDPLESPISKTRAMEKSESMLQICEKCPVNCNPTGDIYPDQINGIRYHGAVIPGDRYYEDTLIDEPLATAR